MTITMIGRAEATMKIVVTTKVAAIMKDVATTKIVVTTKAAAITKIVATMSAPGIGTHDSGSSLKSAYVTS